MNKVKGVIAALAGMGCFLMAIVLMAFIIATPIEYMECKSYARNTGSYVKFSPISGCYIYTEAGRFVQKDTMINIVDPALDPEIVGESAVIEEEMEEYQ